MSVDTGRGSFASLQNDQPPELKKTAGSWARDLALQYDAVAARYEGLPEDPANRLAAVLNRSEAAKYHRIAARMDAAFPGGAPAVSITAGTAAGGSDD